MATEAFIEACAVNIDAAEHPPGIYIELFRRAATKMVRARGNDFAKITRPKKIQDGFYGGRLLIWTDIDIQGRWLDINSEDDLGPDIRKEINIPDQAKANYRSFDYVFNVARHRMYVETKNILRQTVGVTTIHRVMQMLLSREVLGEELPEVTVTIYPEEKALDRVLTLPGLRSLVIRVLRPNADTSSEAARQRVLKRLEDAKAQRLEETWTKSADAPHLIPTPEIQETASVAAEVGIVSGYGRNADGQKNEASTQSYPRRYLLGESMGDTLFTKLAASLRSRF